MSEYLHDRSQVGTHWANVKEQNRKDALTRKYRNEDLTREMKRREARKNSSVNIMSSSETGYQFSEADILLSEAIVERNRSRKRYAIIFLLLCAAVMFITGYVGLEHYEAGNVELAWKNWSVSIGIPIVLITYEILSHILDPIFLAIFNTVKIILKFAVYAFCAFLIFCAAGLVYEFYNSL